MVQLQRLRSTKARGGAERWRNKPPVTRSSGERRGKCATGRYVQTQILQQLGQDDEVQVSNGSFFIARI